MLMELPIGSPCGALRWMLTLRGRVASVRKRYWEMAARDSIHQGVPLLRLLAGDCGGEAGAHMDGSAREALGRSCDANLGEFDASREPEPMDEALRSHASRRTSFITTCTTLAFELPAS